MLKKLHNNEILILIIAIGILLRTIGTNYGFPFIFHPDEPSVVRSALGIRFSPNPGHFDWPHLQIYLNYFLFMAFGKFRDLLLYLGLKSYFLGFWDDKTIFYLLSRLFSALMGALTIIPIYLSSAKFCGKKVGLISAALFSIIPFHVMHSHYALIDVPMVFWVSWALYFSSSIIYSSNIRNYILGGLFVGLAASTKYNGGLTLLMIASAHLLRVFKDKNKNDSNEKLFNIVGLRNLLLAGISGFMGFVLGTPFSIFDFKTFIRTDGPKGALWQFTNVGKVELIPHVSQFFNILFVKLTDDLGYTIMALFIIGVIYYLIRRRSVENLFLIINSIFLIWYISGFEKTRSHYLMIVYPFIVILAGFTAKVLSEKITKKSIILNYIFIVLVLVIPFTLSVKETLAYTKPDTRNILYEWLSLNITDTDIVVYDGDDLTTILKEFPRNYVVKSKNVKLSQVRTMKGYIVVTDRERVTLYAKDTIDNINEYFKKVLDINSIKNNGSRGPKIMVYRLQEIDND